MAKHVVTLIPGDGIGKEVTEAAVKVVNVSGAEIEWEVVLAGEEALKNTGSTLPEETIESIRKNRAALKGPVTTPIGGGFRSVNVGLRQALGLYANIRPVKTINGIKSRYEDVDLVIVRENTEDLYAGVEHMVGENAAESIKIITREASERIANCAFELAVREGRRKVTAVHKANIMKCTDGLFLNCARKIAANYPDIEYEEVIVDAMCMKLVISPEKYDVLVMPNLYGDILSDLGAGLVGGLGITAGGNIGSIAALFEPVHGSAPDIAGKGIANPTAQLMASAMLLDYLGENIAAEKIRNAVEQAILYGAGTPDIGGRDTTDIFVNRILNYM